MTGTMCARVRASGRTFTTTVVVAVAMLIGGPLAGFDIAPGAVAGDSLDVAGRLLSGTAYATAAWDGQAAYVFDGRIQRFVPGVGTTLMGPSVSAAAAVWSGQYAYLFPGGSVLRYDPSRDELKGLGATMSLGEGPTAVWTGTYALVFGGGRVYRFDPTTETAQLMGATFSPMDRRWPASAWDGRYAYVFGGHGGAGPTYDEIHRYDPVADTLTLLPTRLPSPCAYMSAGFGGYKVHLFGGACNSGYSDRILIFDPATGSMTPSARRFPSPICCTDEALWTGSDYLIVGGSPFLDTVHRFTPNKPPTAAIAEVPPAECVGGVAAVTLDGSGSSDPEGDALSFAWTAGPVALDDPASARPSGAFPLGSTTVTLRVSDGDFASSATSQVRVLDTVAPVTAPALLGTPGKNGWWVSDVTFQLTATDACGVASTHFRVNGGDFQSGTSGVIAPELANALEFFSRDIGGNSEAAQAQAVKVDKTRPVVQLVEPVEGNAYVNDVEDPFAPKLPRTVVVGEKTVRATAFDATSGVARVTFLVDGEARFTDFQAPYEFVWAAGQEPLGDHTLRALAEDVAGHTELSLELVVTTVPTTVEGVLAPAGLGEPPPLPGLVEA